MTEKIQFNTHPDQSSFILKSKEMDLEAGWLGKCFGSNKNAPLNIAGFLILALVGSGIVILFVQASMTASDFWEKITPILTLSLGYVFGREL